MALADNLISWYKLDETSGTTATDSVGSNNGTNNGATINQTGKIDKAYDFDGSNDYISTSYSTSLQTFSVCAWVNVGSTNDNIIVGKDTNTGNRGWVFRIDSNNKVSIETNGGEAAVGATALTNGVWAFVCATSDGTNQIVYLNGSSDGTGSRAVLTNADTIAIGRRNYPSAEGYFDGLIDEVAIWSRALTSDEVTSLYNSGDGITYPFSVSSTFTASSPISLSFTIVEENTTISLPSQAVSSLLNIPTLDLYKRDYWSSGTIVVGTGTIGTRFINKKYPFTEGLTAGTTIQKYL